MNHPFNVLIGRPVTHSDLPAPIPENLQFVGISQHDHAALEAKIKEADAFLVYGQQVDATLIDLAVNLKIISNNGVGYDNIDVPYASQKGIIVTNTPTAPTLPTANLTIGLILALSRRIVELDRLIRAHKPFNWNGQELLGRSVSHKKLGLLGFGRIGKAVAQRAIAFDMKVYYSKRSRLSIEEEQRLQVTYCPFEELISTVDILSIHTPLTPDTQALINGSVFEKMRSDAYLINTARGGVIDQDALIQALQQGQIAGAALDVFANEPNIPEALHHLSNVILAPHIGTATPEDRKLMFQEAMNNILDFFDGKPVVNQVN